MANLKKGSTVGGFAITSEEHANNHIHDISDIDGLGGAAGSETGPGSGFDADTLNGHHYADIELDFVNRNGDTIIGDVLLTGTMPTNDLNAISTKYVTDYINSEAVLASNTIPFVSVSPSVSLTYNSNNNSVNVSAGDILIGGKYFSFTAISTTITPTSSTLHYVYMKLSDTTLSLVTYDSPIAHDFKYILLGVVEFTSGGTLIGVRQRSSTTNLGAYSISKTSIRDSMLLSDSSSTLDSNWFNVSFSGNIDTVSLKGDTTVTSGTSVTYKITDYDALSTYNISVDNGSLSYGADEITFNAPSTSSLITVMLSVTRNTNTVDFLIKVTP